MIRSKVSMFKKMDDQLMDALCDRLKPALYTAEIREGDPVDEMLFIMRGKLLSVTTNGRRTGLFNSEYLKGGDFCGKELLTWALDPHSSSNLPISTRTVKALSEVEGFALSADDLKFVANQFLKICGLCLKICGKCVAGIAAKRDKEGTGTRKADATAEALRA